jgi:hypothetical protein
MEEYIDDLESYSIFVSADICPMISGKEKLFQNGCRMRYCVAIILLQNEVSFFGDEIFVELSFDSAIVV